MGVDAIKSGVQPASAALPLLLNKFLARRTENMRDGRGGRGRVRKFKFEEGRGVVLGTISRLPTGVGLQQIGTMAERCRSHMCASGSDEQNCLTSACISFSVVSETLPPPLWVWLVLES